MHASYHANAISFRRHHVDLQTFCDIFKKLSTWKNYTLATCVKQNGDVRRRRSPHISYSSFFPSGLTHIDAFCQLKSTERYENVSRTLAYTWHDRFSDGSTDNTSRGRTKYKNCRIVKSVPDVIDCDLNDAQYEKLLGWPGLVNIQHDTP